MQAYLCSVCGYLYDDESAEISLEGKTLTFPELPTDWICPTCGASPDLFNPVDSDRTPNIST